MEVFMLRPRQHDCQKLHLKFEMPWNKDRLCEHFPNRSSSDKDKWVMPEPVAEKISRISMTMWHWPSHEEAYDWGNEQIWDPLPFFQPCFPKPMLTERKTFLLFEEHAPWHGNTWPEIKMATYACLNSII